MEMLRKNEKEKHCNRNEFEDMSIETFKTDKQREKKTEKIEQNIQELWDDYKRCDIPKGNTRKKREGEEIFEEMV